ncbi:tyrosine-type recombinase/integrase [Bifidobacterium breve]|uniref:tyrosine-type recombinase/integrase n=1 Tax=Bifidobacterium breve TaxID=1685 RepID=UPI00080BD407|nr:tyrosine-type recombinase/integrase [Bifidobacterium breve]
MHTGTKPFGSVIHRPDRNSYRAKYTHHGEIITKTFKDERSAQAWLNAEKALVEADRAGIRRWTSPADRKREETAVERRRVLFCDYVENSFLPTWLEFKSDGGRAEKSTVYQRQEHLKRIREAEFWKAPIQSISAADIERWKNTIVEPWARYHVFKTCKKIFAQASREGVIDANPFDSVKSPSRPKSAQARIPVARENELAVIYDNMPEYSRISVYLGAVLGLRISEICALRVGDVDLKNQTVAVRHSRDSITGGLKGTKTAASNATIHMGDAMTTMLKAQIDGKAPADYVISARRAETIAPQTLRKQLQAAREAAGRPDLHFHTMRKTAITTAVQAGATPADTKKFGRHDDYETSLTFYQMADDDRRLAEISDGVEARLMPHEATVEELEAEIADMERRLAKLKAQRDALILGSVRPRLTEIEQDTFANRLPIQRVDDNRRRTNKENHENERGKEERYRRGDHYPN